MVQCPSGVFKSLSSITCSSDTRILAIACPGHRRMPSAAARGPRGTSVGSAAKRAPEEADRRPHPFYRRPGSSGDADCWGWSFRVRPRIFLRVVFETEHEFLVVERRERCHPPVAAKRDAIIAIEQVVKEAILQAHRRLSVGVRTLGPWLSDSWGRWCRVDSREGFRDNTLRDLSKWTSMRSRRDGQGRWMGCGAGQRRLREGEIHSSPASAGPTGRASRATSMGGSWHHPCRCQ